MLWLAYYVTPWTRNSLEISLLLRSQSSAHVNLFLSKILIYRELIPISDISNITCVLLDHEFSSEKKFLWNSRDFILSIKKYVMKIYYRTVMWSNFLQSVKEMETPYPVWLISWWPWSSEPNLKPTRTYSISIHSDSIHIASAPGWPCHRCSVLNQPHVMHPSTGHCIHWPLQEPGWVLAGWAFLQHPLVSARTRCNWCQTGPQ